MATILTTFQDCFAQALLAPDNDIAPDIERLVQQPGFAVYRNTITKGCIDALQANYPAVARIVGEEWFRAAAAIYVRLHQPRDARMLYYGEDFATFLENFEPAAELPYLPDVARLDRMWTEAHAARDETPVEPAALSGLTPDVLGGTVLHPHASARWKWFAEDPIFTIWQRNREAQDDDSEIAWRGEGALLVRPHDAVEWIALDGAGCAFLDACQAGLPLADAAAAALGAQPDTNLAQLLSTLLHAGAFGSIHDKQ